ncbi:bifunctional hydroxymethylpyrimidine kinase/phosphomethylpyrimidine kinase [Methylocapsa palsarum]|uniref:hydroxymethylpyrimidine kinase n=1 Tax=Methylocapsa palsarum TaxID=1612308 RepID=A0A1I4BDC4_9HYPH|nr:bifunctional hydroxymethylpyrimidine kinase/phosphomethylpyrimidine kinase [Methylocapsa palsarum]SFK66812.1 hydroxymethylpyrimidine/phosphomethylpyrimidine kinase [Methylocapsa palsarum]
MIPNLLSIAGSDPSGGAGIQADLKTFAALRCHGMAVITALTAQNTLGVKAIHLPPPEFVSAQIDAIFADIEVAAVKTGMLASAAIVAAVADRLAVHRPRFIVVDPVLVASSGDLLTTPDVGQAIVRHLFPLATIITPNQSEAALLTGLPFACDHAQKRATAEALLGLGAKAALVKGGHDDGASADDLLFDGLDENIYSAPRIATRNNHGTGCTLSSAIAASLAQGLALPEAVGAAKAFLTAALAAADELNVGHGHGPAHHFSALWPRSSGDPR